MRSHYHILGIAPSADRAAIKAAYLSLIKRHHPDTAGCRDRTAEARAKDINSAFWVLGDAARRAAYDGELERARRAEAARIAALAHQFVYAPPKYPVVPYSRPRKRFRSLKVAASLVILLAASTSGALLGEPKPPLPFALAGQGFAASEVRAAEPIIVSPGIDPGDVSEAVSDLLWIVAEGRRGDAVSYSLHCFGEFQLNPSYHLLDRCVAFDQSAKWTLDTSAVPRESPDYFAAKARREQHLEASAMLSKDKAANAARLGAIEKHVVSSMARTMSAKTTSPAVQAGSP